MFNLLVDAAQDGHRIVGPAAQGIGWAAPWGKAMASSRLIVRTTIMTANGNPVANILDRRVALRSSSNSGFFIFNS